MAERGDKRVAFQCAHCGLNQTRAVRRGFYLRCRKCGGPNPGPAMTTWKPDAGIAAKGANGNGSPAVPPAEPAAAATAAVAAPPKRRRAVIRAAEKPAAAVTVAPAGQPEPQPADIPGSHPGHTGQERQSGSSRWDRLMYGG